MRSRTTERFRKAFARLPAHVQRQARKAYRQFQGDPNHPSLEFKKVHPSRPIYSARVSLGYRALGVIEGEEILRFWIGSHADYNRLLTQRRLSFHLGTAQSYVHPSVRLPNPTPSNFV